MNDYVNKKLDEIDLKRIQKYCARSDIAQNCCKSCGSLQVDVSFQELEGSLVDVSVNEDGTNVWGVNSEIVNVFSI